ncbi:MAG: hypothetical protein JW821_03910 [Deltaproteobacteria bacterium]|nr:hypothetical protein [Deltaproteobacteria bacterium]
MKHMTWQTILGVSLVLLSAFFYLIHFLLFRDAHHIFIFLVGDIAFVPIEVLLVTLIIHRLLAEREKQSLLEKLNMLIGVFFSEIGTGLIKTFSAFDPDSPELRHLIKGKSFAKESFSDLRNHIKVHRHRIEIKDVDLGPLRQLLSEKRPFLLGLIENPNLFEHDTFTQLLWAVFHLTEELVYREDLSTLPENDIRHIAGDISRAYDLIIVEWLDYMNHLRSNYPYLFSLAVRMNPFDPNASPVVA